MCVGLWFLYRIQSVSVDAAMSWNRTWRYVHGLKHQLIYYFKHF
jgi:hypothetical protein